jgi:hypothetical protein
VFIDTLGKGSAFVRALRCSFLIDFLYNDFNKFEDAVSRFSVADCESRSQPPKYGLAYDEGKLASAVKTATRFISAHPGASRSELLAKCSYPLRYIMHNDFSAYEQIAPISRRRTGQSQARNERSKCLDENFCSYAQKRYAILRADLTLNARKLSIGTLLLGHPSVKRFYGCPEDYPKTTQFINSVLLANREIC